MQCWGLGILCKLLKWPNWQDNSPWVIGEVSTWGTVRILHFSSKFLTDDHSNLNAKLTIWSRRKDLPVLMAPATERTQAGKSATWGLQKTSLEMVLIIITIIIILIIIVIKILGVAEDIPEHFVIILKVAGKRGKGTSLVISHVSLGNGCLKPNFLT